MSTVLAKMAVQISANTAEFNKALQSTSNNLKNFTGGLTKIAGTIGLAFSAQQVAAFAVEVAKLSGEAEAVRIAFERLPNSIKLMNQLKEATGGTVSELELMKRAVQASNFDISLEALPRLLEFATLRAQQTGQSVDYLVDSIVTGIGRKSKLILDNLGISAAQLSAELNGVSAEASTVAEVADAVGRIAEKNLANMAGFAENASTKLQRLNASWENLKVTLGDAVNSGGFLGGAVDTLTRFFDIFSSDNLTALQKFETYLVAAFMPQNLSEFTRALKDLDAEMNKNNQLAEEAQQRINTYDAQLLINKYNGIQSAIEGFTSAFKDLNNVDMSTLSESELRQFSQFEAILKILQSRLNEVSKTQVNAIDTIAEYRAEIKRLTEENENLGLSDAKTIQNNGILIEQYEAQIKKLQDLAKVKRDVMKIEQIDRSPTYAPLGSPKPFSMDEVAPDGKVDLSPIDTSAFEETADQIRGIQLDLSDSTADFVGSMAETLGAAFSGTYDFGRGFLLALARFAGSFGKQLIALGVAALAAKKVFVNPVAAIAAGVALTVASAAVAGSIKNYNSSGGPVSGTSSGGGRIGSTSSLATNAAQNEFSYETVIRGQDLYVVLSNYNRNRDKTSAIGG